ncbi:unnamed protein product, partial [Ascophyllum nodosum]
MMRKIKNIQSQEGFKGKGRMGILGQKREEQVGLNTSLTPGRLH